MMVIRIVCTVQTKSMQAECLSYKVRISIGFVLSMVSATHAIQKTVNFCYMRT